MTQTNFIDADEELSTVATKNTSQKKNKFAPAPRFALFVLSLLGLYLSLYLIFKFVGESLLIPCTTVIFDIFLVVWLITRRFFLATFVIGFGLLCLYGSCIFKQQILGTPLLIHDIYFFLQDFKENIATFIQYPKISFSIISLAALFFGGFAFLYRRESPIGITRAVVITCITLVCFSAKPIANTYQTPPADVEIFDEMEMLAGESDYLSKFLSSIAILNSDVHLDDFPVKSFSLAPTRPDHQKADIIGILHESAFNLQAVKDCPKDFCNLDLFKEDSKTLQSGFLKVHVKGGGTWLSEFAFLTGLDHHIFGDNGLYAPYTLAPHISDSMVRNLKQQGYHTVGIYPIEGNFLHATDAYKHYGFDEFLSSRELGFPDDWLQVYDGDVYNKTIEYIQKSNPNKPLFIFISTIQNHGPHEEYLNNNAPILKLNKNTETKSFLEVYRQRYYQSIQDIAHFEKFLLGRKKKTVVVRFGDHQPSFDGKIDQLDFNYPKELGVKDKNYYTKYVIKANFNKLQKRLKVDEDISFIAGDSLNFAGVELTDYTKANLAMKEKCHGKFLDCENQTLLRNYLGFILGNLKVYNRN